MLAKGATLGSEINAMKNQEQKTILLVEDDTVMGNTRCELMENQRG